MAKKKGKAKKEEPPSHPAGTTGSFDVSSDVLAFHGPLLYDAKITDARTAEEGSDQFQYFLHYNGWSKKWDEWVTQDRIVIKNPENVAYQKELKTKNKDKDKKRKSAGALGGGLHKRVRQGLEVGEDVTVLPPTCGEGGRIKVAIPAMLKKVLVEDWTQITRNNKTVCLPVPQQHSIHSILSKWQAHEDDQNKETHSKVVKEVVDGLQKYFQRALSTTLLYRFERPQCEDLGGKHKDMCKVYGLSHLLRLLVKLPILLVYSNIMPDQAKLLEHKLAELIKFLRSSDSEFDVEYQEPGADYEKRVAEIELAESTAAEQ